jgi:hypothetical protein
MSGLNKETEKFVNESIAKIRADSLLVVQSMIDFADEHKLTTESEFRGMLESYKEYYEQPVFAKENMS